MKRRDFLQAGLSTTVVSHLKSAQSRSCLLYSSGNTPAYSVVPVVGDGVWIWNDPPKDGTGYLEPRSYDVSVGIQLEGIGNATQILSTTIAPIEYPEQKIEDFKIITQGCQAMVRKLEPFGGQLVLSAANIVKGQVISAVAQYRLTLYKQFKRFQKEMFPKKQIVPNEVKKYYMQDSPGIQTRDAKLKELAKQITNGLQHPWDQAKAIAQWIPKNIRPQIGTYTSVSWAVENRRGDCEEMAGLFVAACRSLNIPARLIWVPNHVWAEFYLEDDHGEGHWIPVHVACYFWFGWNGAHELVLQKGDRYYVPERRKRLRLLEDWTQYQGRKPRIRYTAKLTPVAKSSEEDQGPGARRKDDKGEWALLKNHPLDRYVRR